MNQTTFTITPEINEIDLTADIYRVIDHIPDLDNFVEHASIDFLIQNPNSLKYYFDQHGIDYREKKFIFDHYLYFEDFKDNSRFYPHLFITDVDEFLKYEKDNNINYNFSIDQIMKKKHVPLNCLMNKSRPHREIASCWLLNNIPKKNLLYTQSWDHKEISITKKFVDFLHNKNSIQQYNELPRRWIKFHNAISDKSNPERFYQYFNPQIFSKTLLSLVLEPDFLVNACSISEKYVYAIKGLTIPIVSGYKIYEKLKILGFHVFDDIIDTNYQYETHPVKRIWKMLESNRELMSGTVKRFKNDSVKQRMFDNYNHISDVEALIFNFDQINRTPNVSVF